MYREKTNKYILELFTKNNENPNKESLDVHLDCRPKPEEIESSDAERTLDYSTEKQSSEKQSINSSNNNKTLKTVLSDYDQIYDESKQNLNKLSN